MADLFLLPAIAAVLAMVFSRHCMKGEFPFRGLFTFVIGCTSFAAVFVLALIYTIVKALLP